MVRVTHRLAAELDSGVLGAVGVFNMSREFEGFKLEWLLGSQASSSKNLQRTRIGGGRIGGQRRVPEVVAVLLEGGVAVVCSDVLYL